MSQTTDKNPHALICADADAPKVVAGASFDRGCGTCGRKVMIAPSGQRLLAKRPKMEIVCMACFVAQAPRWTDIQFSQPSPKIIEAELATAMPNLRRRRN